MTGSTAQDLASWWGIHEFPANRWVQWEIGPLRLSVLRRPREWRIAWRSDGDRLDPVCRRSDDNVEPPTLENDDIRRYIGQGEDNRLEFVPRLADRPVVVNPDIPVFLPPGEKTTLYVSTAAWLRLAEPDGSMLTEIPVYRPSDTWFGPNTREGEIAYASRTSARTSLDELTVLHHRVITPVRIDNRGVDALLVEQLRIPVPALTLYEIEGQGLWTGTVAFTRREGDNTATLQIQDGRELPGPDPRQLAPPRVPVERNAVVHAFSRIFS